MTIVAGLMHPAPMHIREWPSTERPREKLLLRGPGALSDAELLAIFLGSGLPGRDAVQTGRELLEGHGPLRALLDRAPVELARLPGLGPARACALAARGRGEGFRVVVDRAVADGRDAVGWIGDAAGPGGWRLDYLAVYGTFGGDSEDVSWQACAAIDVLPPDCGTLDGDLCLRCRD